MYFCSMRNYVCMPIETKKKNESDWKSLRSISDRTYTTIDAIYRSLVEDMNKTISKIKYINTNSFFFGFTSLLIKRTLVTKKSIKTNTSCTFVGGICFCDD